ncbi:MAG: ATP-binding cassette domain-containing protein [Flavobacteriales bacterium]|nr:ATP-binding cassette domain-containing protein [Flavobacteriales bacterium]
MKERKTKAPRVSWKESLWLFRYVRPYRWRLAIGSLFLVLTSATALIFPKLMGDLVGTAEQNLTQNIDKAALVLMILFVAQAFFSFMRVYLFVQVTENMLADLRQDTYRKLLGKPMSFFSQTRVGELNSRVAADITQLQGTFTTNVAEFVRQLIIIVGGIGLLAFTSLKLTGIMVMVIPPMAILAVFFGRYIRKISKSVQEEVAVSNTILDETLQAIASVKAYTNEVFEWIRFSNSTRSIVKKAMKGAVWRGAFSSFIIFCLFGSIVVVIWYGLRMVQSGELNLGLLIQFMLYTVFVGASTGGIAAQYAQIQQALGATERLREIQQGEQEDVMQPSSDGERLKGDVDFQDVSFAYPSRKEVTVLNNVSLNIRAGERVAFVGPSGAGKSTLTALLLRFYDADSGQILLDGKPIDSMTLHKVRSNMGIVPQEVLLFGGTIRENIAYGKKDASEEEVIAAADKANALAFIKEFPDGLDTVVGERGIQLSGGQRQRIAIARAVLKDPSILILDEATSSLDSESERLVQDALDKLMKGRTSIIIAHRFSTIRSADKIVVLDHGTVVETGRHEELIRNDEGLYAHLSKLQFETA